MFIVQVGTVRGIRIGRGLDKLGSKRMKAHDMLLHGAAYLDQYSTEEESG